MTGDIICARDTANRINCERAHLIRREGTVRRSVPLHVRRRSLGFTAVVVLRLGFLDLLQKFRPRLLGLLERVLHFLALLQGHHRLQTKLAQC